MLQDVCHESLLSNAAGSAWYTTAAIRRARLAIQLAGADAQQGVVPIQQGGLPLQQGVVPIQQGGLPLQQGVVHIQQGGVPFQSRSLVNQQRGVPVQQGGRVTPIQQGGRPTQHGGSRRRLFAESDPAVMRMVKVPRLSTMSILQVSSRHAWPIYNHYILSVECCMSTHPCTSLAVINRDVKMFLLCTHTFIWVQTLYEGGEWGLEESVWGWGGVGLMLSMFKGVGVRLMLQRVDDHGFILCQKVLFLVLLPTLLGQERIHEGYLMQVSSPYWQQVIGVRQQRLQADQQQGQGVQLVQSEISAGFWELCEASFRPIGSGGICLGAVE